MALQMGKVVRKPDLACVGIVKKVNDAYLSEKGVYHVLPVEIEAKAGGQSNTFYFLFQPTWFERGFDLEALAEADPKLYGSYRKFIADEKRPSILQCLVGEENFNNLEALTKATPKDITALIRENALGNDVGYVCYQRTDEDGTLMDQYNINRFFPVTDAGVEAIINESQNDKRRRGPLVITWDED
jgi:hypothetical protein